MIHGGILHGQEKYVRLLQQNKYYIIPTVNVDGLQYIEDHYKKTGIIEAKRTNMNINLVTKECNTTTGGVDLNRNYGYNWGVNTRKE